MASRIGSAVWYLWLLCFHIAWLSIACYLVAGKVLGLFSMTCFGALELTPTSKPFVELQSAYGVAYVFEESSLVFEKQSPYQLIQVYAHRQLGNILVIEGSLQITTRDEVNYHEMMVHVPLAYLHDATKVLIIGGGDGGALTRVLQHPNIEEVHLVDIDGFTMRDMTLDYFPHLYSGFLDRRTRLHSFDGNAWVRERLMDPNEVGSFDLIIVDSTDFGSAETLFTDAFYANLKQLLRPQRGVLLVNLDSPSWNLDIVSSVQRQLSRHFVHPYVYQAHQPTFLSGHYSYMMCSDGIHPMKQPINWKSWSSKLITTYYYSPELHYGAFLLPMAVQRQLSVSAQLRDVPRESFFDSELPKAYWPTVHIPEERMPAASTSAANAEDADAADL